MRKCNAIYLELLDFLPEGKVCLKLATLGADIAVKLSCQLRVFEGFAEDRHVSHVLRAQLIRYLAAHVDTHAEQTILGLHGQMIMAGMILG